MGGGLKGFLYLGTFYVEIEINIRCVRHTSSTSFKINVDSALVFLTQQNIVENTSTFINYDYHLKFVFIGKNHSVEHFIAKR